MEGLEAAAKKLLEQMQAKEDPFAKLDRDLPKGGRQIKIATPEFMPESAPVAAPAAAASALSGLVAPLATVAGMLIPREISPDLIGKDEKGYYPQMEQKMKGEPVMQEMTEATKLATPKLSKEQKLMKRFEEEGKKHIGPEFTLGVEEREGSETGPVSAKYKLQMSSKDKLSDQDKMKAAGIHSFMRQKGVKKGEINLPVSKSNVVELEDEE